MGERVDELAGERFPRIVEFVTWLSKASLTVRL